MSTARETDAGAAARRGSAEGSETGAGDATRRTLRWLLGAQVALAVLLVCIDLIPALPDLLRDSDRPALDQPTRPGDQTRRYAPRQPATPGPGIDPDMPRRLELTRIDLGGQDALRLRGAVAEGDGPRISAALRAAFAAEGPDDGADDSTDVGANEGEPAPPPDLVLLDSPGGSVRDALEIGRSLRALDTATRLEAGAICLSACPYILAGGTTRIVADAARVGVHQHSYGENTVLPLFIAIEDIQRGQAEVVAHLDAMGVDLRIMQPLLATPAHEIYILTREEMTGWGVVTD